MVKIAVVDLRGRGETDGTDAAEFPGRGVAATVSSCARKSPAVANRISGRTAKARSTISSSRTSICTLCDGGSRRAPGSSPVSNS